MRDQRPGEAAELLRGNTAPAVPRQKGRPPAAPEAKRWPNWESPYSCTRPLRPDSRGRGVRGEGRVEEGCVRGEGGGEVCVRGEGGGEGSMKRRGRGVCE